VHRSIKTVRIAFALLVACTAWLAAATTTPAPSTSTVSRDRFTIVLIDAKTEAALGEFPYSRSLYAEMLDRLQQYEVRAICLKFFLDQPKDEEGDAALETAMAHSKVPILLEACLRNDEASTSRLDDRFCFSAKGLHVERLVGGEKGWLPMERFQKYASAVGFVDVSDVDRAPIFEKLGSRVVRSLPLALIECADGATARITPDQRLQIGPRTLQLDAEGQVRVRVPAPDVPLGAISMRSVLKGDAPRERLRGRVVVVAYDGAKMPLIKTSLGEYRADCLAWWELLSIDEQLQEAPPATRAGVGDQRS
jgi:hypothetical protein